MRAAVRFVAELERSMVEPQRLVQALRAWAGDGPRRGYAEDVGAIYLRYRQALESAIAEYARRERRFGGLAAKTGS